MVVRARSLAVLALAAMPLPAHGLIGLLKPTFSCDSSQINWGDGAALNVPGISLVPQPEPDVPAVQFGCSNNLYSAGITGNTFALNFGNFKPANPNDAYDLKLFTDYKESTFLNPDGALQDKWDTYFDMYIELLNADGFVQYKEFVGLKLDSMFGFSTEGKFFMADGSVFLDPTIPGGNAELFLTDTPAVPEPATLALVGSGIAGGILRRKRKARA